MCGISFLIRQIVDCDDDLELKLWDEVCKQIKKRGPDHFSTYNMENLSFAGSLLHIQGQDAVNQPFIDEYQNVLLWNGELFEILGKNIHIDRSHYKNDTTYIAYILSHICSSKDSNEAVIESMLEFFAYVVGPYAFIYFNRARNVIFYARDPFGRRSLLKLKNIETCNSKQRLPFLLCSTGGGSLIDGYSFQFEEIPNSGVYYFQLGKDFELESPRLKPWPSYRLSLTRNLEHDKSLLNKPADTIQLLDIDASAQHLIKLMTKVLQKRLQLVHDLSSSANTELMTRQTDSWSKTQRQVSKVGVLFSGGIDSVFIAAILHLATPVELSIDLINVSFGSKEEFQTKEENPSASSANPSPDRLAAIAAFIELVDLYPERKWNLVHVDVSHEERATHEHHILQLIQPQDTHMDLNIGTAFWFAARGRGYLHDYSVRDLDQIYSVRNNGRPLLRIGEKGASEGCGHDVSNFTLRGSKDSPIANQPLPCLNLHCKHISKDKCLFQYCKNCCIQARKSRLSQKVQGWLDTHTAWPPSSSHDSVIQPPPFPWIELHKNLYCPAHHKDKKMQMFVVNFLSNLQLSPPHGFLTSQFLTQDEVLNEKFSGLTENRTAQEDAEGKQNRIEDEGGDKIDPAQRRPYASQCKVLLVGIGADEQLAGYGRHRTLYAKFGLDALLRELNMDTERIWRRNLGRDDRCISDHGREAWFPFLDENIVRYFQSLPVAELFDLELPPGVGDKRILRQAGKILGLGNSTMLVKRAIQFGTRVAKHTNALFHGSNRKGKGQTRIDISAKDVAEEE